MDSVSPASGPILRVRNLGKEFHIHHLRRSFAPFRQVSFDLLEGEFALLTGENGAGKSTLLRSLYRSYLPTSGHAYFRARQGIVDLAVAADVDVTLLRRGEIGFVTQFLNARPRVSAEALVAEPLRANGLADSLDQARHWLAAFGVKADLWAGYPSTFSGGEQQKVNLARTLVVPPRLLLLDEPTASLDRAAREALTVRLRELKASGVTIIGIFHHPQDVAGLVDREINLQAKPPVLDIADVAE